MTVTPEGWLAVAYGLLGPGAWALVAFTSAKGRARLAIRKTPVPSVDALAKGAPPRVSLIVPCRNEAAGIEACLRSALAQDYPDFEVIAVDDRSDDGTAAIVDAVAAAEPRLRALHVREGELPPGWLGKPNAVCRGVAASDGAWLVFIDSDCTLAPTVVREAVATGLDRGFDLVSFVPRFVGSGFWDSLLTPLCGMATGGMYSMIWANAFYRPQTAFACGQFIAVRRAAYDAVGGHAALRDSAGEDVEMARRLKRAGFKPRLGWGMDLVTTRMYSTLGGIFDGWGRNFIAASRGSTWRVWGAIAFVLLCTLTVWPVLAWGLAHAGTLNGRVWLGVGLPHLGLITWALVDGYRWGRAKWAYALLWPLGTGLLLAVFVRSLYFARRRQVVWRGVRYDPRAGLHGLGPERDAPMSNAITPVRGNGGLEKIVIDHPQAEGEIYLHGAHVTHWKPAAGEAVLWLSPKAVFKDGVAVRGGVPVCLPWFGPHPAGASGAPAHGLVRTRAWELADAREDASGVAVRLRVAVAADASPHWTHPFAAELAVHFGRTLTLSLSVTNTGPQAFRYAEALHTYLRVRDVRETSVGGLVGTTYLDKTAGGARRRDDNEAIEFAAETDRAYVGTAATCVVQDQHLGRRIFVEKTGSRSTVVWNPFDAKAAAAADIGADNWPGFVCVETANCADDTITLAAGATHETKMTLRLEPIENA